MCQFQEQHTLEEVNQLFLHAGQREEGAEFSKNSSNSPVFRCVTELPETFDQEMLKNKKVSKIAQPTVFLTICTYLNTIATAIQETFAKTWICLLLAEK